MDISFLNTDTTKSLQIFKNVLKTYFNQYPIQTFTNYLFTNVWNSPEVQNHFFKCWKDLNYLWNNYYPYKIEWFSKSLVERTMH